MSERTMRMQNCLTVDTAADPSPFYILKIVPDEFGLSTTAVIIVNCDSPHHAPYLVSSTEQPRSPGDKGASLRILYP
jgi:hypothetical protein